MSDKSCRLGEKCRCVSEHSLCPNWGIWEMFDGKLTRVINGDRSGWWRYHDHYDRNGYCDNPARERAAVSTLEAAYHEVAITNSKLRDENEQLRATLAHLLYLGILNPTGSPAIYKAVADAKALLNAK